MSKYTYTTTLFKQEINNFTNRYWWVYIIFFSTLALVYTTSTGNIYEILGMFCLHLLGDVFTMMMLVAYADNKLKLGGTYQMIATMFFILVGINSIVVDGTWVYLISTLIFGLASLKNFFKNVFEFNMDFIDLKLVLFANILSVLAYIYFGLDLTLFVWIQILGFTLFSCSLSMGIKSKQKIKYLLGLGGVFFITLGSFLVFFESFKQGKIIGADISFALLPLTIFVVQLGLWKKYF